MARCQDSLPRIPYPNNMGVVRYVLALSVFIAHFNELTGSGICFPVSSYTGVGGFFALSGFLVYGSFMKTGHVGDYVRKRAIRLLPAYFATVLFFALVLSLCSTLPVWRYFTSGHFWRYLAANLSFMNFAGPTLPGVFDDLRISAVNGSLWTMKVEWALYLSVPVVAFAIRKTRCRHLLAFTMIYLLSVGYRIWMYGLYRSTGNPIYEILGRQFIGQLMYFYCGVAVYFIFPFFMRHRNIFLLAAVAAVFFQSHIPYYGIAVGPAAVTIIVIYLSLTGKWGSREAKHDNVSYNIYLIHFPVIQIAISLGLTQIWGTTATFALCGVAIVLMSVLMNRYVEKPIMGYFRAGGRNNAAAHRVRR